MPRPSSFGALSETLVRLKPRELLGKDADLGREMLGLLEVHRRALPMVLSRGKYRSRVSGESVSLEVPRRADVISAEGVFVIPVDPLRTLFTTRKLNALVYVFEDYTRIFRLPPLRIQERN